MALLEFSSSYTLRSFALLCLLASACVDGKSQEKGVVDTSTPPGSPFQGLGKADSNFDSNSRIVPLSVASIHPYANNMDEEYTIDLSEIPFCASRVRLHFSALRLEDGYDTLLVVDAFGQDIQTITGTQDDSYSSWLDLGSTERSVSLVLQTDYSVVRYGFEVDYLEWEGGVICPAFVPSPCPTGQVDINPAQGVCGCPAFPTCVDLLEVTASHSTGGGFSGGSGGSRIDRTVAYSYSTQTVTSPLVEKELGRISDEALTNYIRSAALSGALRGSENSPSNFYEQYSMQAGAASADYLHPAGASSQPEAESIALYESLFVCGPGEPLTCGENMKCDSGTCVLDAVCRCVADGMPVCGVNNQTYPDWCTASCVGIEVKHEGSCGIVGDTCGGNFGLPCQPEHKCRYDEGAFLPPFPDASGLCVQDAYCDSPSDCTNLPTETLSGTWSCEVNLCQWQAGSNFQPVPGWSMESAHPYGNNASVWEQLYLPEGAQTMRLEITGTFSLETDYDFLEIWTYQAGSWQKQTQITGVEADGASYEFAGGYHYIHFVSDSSVTDFGYSLSASYAL